MPEFETRVGAYGVIVEQGKILLAHFNAFGAANWTLPGGGLEVGEDGEAAAVREVFEETGYRVSIESLLGVDSVQLPATQRIDGRPLHLHSLRLIYRGRIVGGDLKCEIDGSTDDARWFSLQEVAGLNRVDLVDAGIRMWKESPLEIRT